MIVALPLTGEAKRGHRPMVYKRHNAAWQYDGCQLNRVETKRISHHTTFNTPTQCRPSTPDRLPRAGTASAGAASPLAASWVTDELVSYAILNSCVLCQRLSFSNAAYVLVAN